MENKMLFGVGLVFDTPEFGTIVMGANEELDELLPSTTLLPGYLPEPHQEHSFF